MALPTSIHERPRRTAIRAARVFDGHVMTDGPTTVLIDGSSITAVVSGHVEPENAELVDLAGATVMPGLIDTHVHLCFDASPDPVATLAERDDDAARTAMTAAARTALAGGVTTLRDLGDRTYLSLGLRTPDPAPVQPLPRILAAGPPITTLAGHCHFLGGAIADDPRAMRAAVRERAERGCDVIKVMSSGGVMTPGSRQEEAQFTREVLTAAVDEAHRCGLPLTAHAHGTSAIADCVAAGVDGMEHVSFWTTEGVEAPEHLLAAITERRIVVGMTVGMAPAPDHVPPPEIVARLPLILATLRGLVERGAVVVAGTDAGIAPPKPHDVLRTALGQLAEVGIGPLEALRVATTGAARVVGLADRVGRIAAGFEADLLIVDGDPLADPEAIHRILAVYARGVRV